MRKTSVSILFLFFSVNNFAVENCTQGNETKVAKELGTSFDPKICTIVSDAGKYKDFFMFPNSQKEKCLACQNLLPLTSMDGTDFQKRVIRAALDEVRQKMSRTIISLLSVRSNTSLPLDAKPIGNACNISNYKPSCWKNINEKIGDGRDFVADLKTQFSNEIASNFVNNKLQQNKIKDNGLFTRAAIDCRFTDYDVLNARTRMIENAFSPNMIKSLKKYFPPESTNENGNLGPSEAFKLKLKKAMTEVDIKVDFFLKHPMLLKLFQHPEKFQSFVKSLDDTKYTPEIIRDKINSPENAALFGKSLESECRDSFNNLERVICDPKLLNGKFAISSKEDLSLLYGTDVPPAGLNESDVINEEQLTALSGYCKAITLKNDDTKLITILNTPLKDASLIKKVDKPDIYDSPFYKFKETAHADIVGQHKKAVCDIDSGKLKCEANDSRSHCVLYNTLKNQNNPTIIGTTVPDKTMAFDENINHVLSSIAGSFGQMSNETKTILTQHGILKNESKLAAPIPQPSSFQEIAKKVTNNKASPQPTTVNNPQPAPQPPISNNPNPAVNANNQNESSNATQTTQNLNTATINKNQTQTKETPADNDNSIYKKLLDKISNLPKKANGETTKLTDQDIENLVKKALEEQNKQSAKPQEVRDEKNNFYDKISKYIPKPPMAPIDQRTPNPTSGDSSEQNRPSSLTNNSNNPQDRTISSSTGPSINPKTNPVTSTTQNKVIKVNTNNVEAIVITLKDEKIKESSEIKNLIASKTNFVLEINEMSFTINFANPNDVNSEQLTIATSESGPIAKGIKQKLETYFHSQEVKTQINQIRLSNLNNILGTLKL